MKQPTSFKADSAFPTSALCLQRHRLGWGVGAGVASWRCWQGLLCPHRSGRLSRVTWLCAP